MRTSTWGGTTLRNNGRLAHIRGRDNCRVIVLLVVPEQQWRMSTVVQQKKISWYDGHLEILAFLDVRPLKLGEGVLSIVGMSRGGILEIFFDPLSRAVLRFLWIG